MIHVLQQIFIVTTNIQTTPLILDNTMPKSSISVIIISESIKQRGKTTITHILTTSQIFQFKTLRVLKTAPEGTINTRRIISIFIDPTSTCLCTCIMFKWRISVKQYKNKTKIDVLWYYASTYRPVRSFHHFVPILYQIYYRKIRSVRIGSTYWKIIY